MQRPTEKKTIYIVPKDPKNQSLFWSLHRQYGDLYKVDYLYDTEMGHPADYGNNLEKLDPEHVALTIIPGYSGSQWKADDKVKKAFIDYLEAGGNLLMICDAVLSFIKKGLGVRETDGRLQEFYFDEGNNGLPDAIISSKLGTKEAKDNCLARSVVGPHLCEKGELSSKFRPTTFYRANSACILLAEDCDADTVLPISRVRGSCKSYPFAHRNKNEQLMAFNMLYIRQGKGNLVLSLDHNEENPMHFFLSNVVFVAYLGVLCSLDGKKVKVSDVVGNVWDMASYAAKWLKAGGLKYERFNRGLRRFMYEEMLGLENPRGAIPASKLDPSLAAINERIRTMRDHIKNT